MFRKDTFQVFGFEQNQKQDFFYSTQIQFLISEDWIRSNYFVELIVESEDSVEINGKVFQKPFVEKPISAEDHNVYIYFPTSAGGGSQRLFRKASAHVQF